MTTNLAGVRKPAHWYAMLPAEQLEWAVNEIGALTDQLQHAKNTINVLVAQRDELTKPPLTLHSMSAHAQRIIDTMRTAVEKDISVYAASRPNWSHLKNDIQDAIESAHAAGYAEGVAGSVPDRNARKTDDGTQIMPPELHRPWDFRPPQDQEEFYCVIGTTAYMRTFKRTMREAIEHAQPMFKRDGAKKLLVVRVERVLEQAAPPIVARAPVAGDFPR